MTPMFLRPRAWAGRLIAPLAVAAALLSAPAQAPAQAWTPLPQTRGGTIPMRVLSRPDAALRAEPGGGAALESPWPFALFYVFDTEVAGGETWLQVGPNRSGPPSAWMAQQDGLEWRHTLVLSFTPPEGRLPALFFDTRENMVEFVESERLLQLAPDYVARTRAGAPPEGAGIVSIEPEEAIDFSKEFYLLPILDAQEVFLQSAFRRAKIFEIASAALREPVADVDRDLKIGVVFVIDTTLSMEPYIRQTLDVVRSLVTTLETSERGDRVDFGLVGFRDDPTGRLGVEYAARTYLPLSPGNRLQDIVDALADVDDAEGSTVGFAEDGLAGFVEAMETDAWDDYDGRIVIYIGDSPVKEAPEGGTTGLTVDQVSLRARRDHDIIPMTVLLQTPAGRAYHAIAAEQLSRLAYQGGGEEPLFYRVENGGEADFGELLAVLTDELVEVIELTDRAAPPPPAGPLDCDDPAQAANCIGPAIRLLWLGRTEGVGAPDIIRGWTPQFALDDPVNGYSFDVNILLTRAQVNNLYARLGLILTASEAIMDSEPGALFEALVSVLAEAARDPAMLDSIEPGAASIAAVSELPTLGTVLDEYLGGLPFRTPLMGIDEDEWRSMDGGGRDRILTSVRSARRLLAYYYEDDGGWIALHPDAGDGERVYALPFEVLP